MREFDECVVVVVGVARNEYVPGKLLAAVPRAGATVGLADFSDKIVVPSHTLESTCDFRSKCVTTTDDHTL